MKNVKSTKCIFIIFPNDITRVMVTTSTVKETVLTLYKILSTILNLLQLIAK